MPERLLEEARCIAILPKVVKGAFVWGGRRGQGVMSCRNDERRWSPPAFVKITGGSFGLQAGAQSTDLVMFFMTELGARSLIDSKFILGGDVTVAAGPVGRAAAANTDIRLKAEVYAYARSRGLFAGVSIEGAQLSVYQNWMRALLRPPALARGHPVQARGARAAHRGADLHERPAAGAGVLADTASRQSGALSNAALRYPARRSTACTSCSMTASAACATASCSVC